MKSRLGRNEKRLVANAKATIESFESHIFIARCQIEDLKEQVKRGEITATQIGTNCYKIKMAAKMLKMCGL